MDAHQHFCEQFINDFKSRYGDVVASYQRTVGDLIASRDEQALVVQTCEDLLKPSAQLLLGAIILHIDYLQQQHEDELTILSNRSILDGLEGHQALEGNRDICKNKMAFREAFIFAIRETSEFHPSEQGYAAMDEFLIDEDIDNEIVQLLNLINLPRNSLNNTDDDESTRDSDEETDNSTA